MLSCVDKGNDKETASGLVGLASPATVSINVSSSRVCVVAVKGMVCNTIPCVLWRFVGRLNKFVHGFVNGLFPRPAVYSLPS